MFDKLKIENQLAELRQKWLKKPNDRPIIERQAKCLKLALNKLEDSVDSYKFAEGLFNGNKSEQLL